MSIIDFRQAKLNLISEEWDPIVARQMEYAGCTRAEALEDIGGCIAEIVRSNPDKLAEVTTNAKAALETMVGVCESAAGYRNAVVSCVMDPGALERWAKDIEGMEPRLELAHTRLWFYGIVNELPQSDCCTFSVDMFELVNAAVDFGMAESAVSAAFGYADRIFCAVRSGSTYKKAKAKIRRSRKSSRGSR